jgi:hypothetical protein
MTGLVQFRAHAHIVFAPLAASAFLISRTPFERSNSIGVVASSQFVGAAAGTAASMIARGYAAEALAMIATISILIALDWVHAPAIPTALICADEPMHVERFAFFAAALSILGLLSAGQQALYHKLNKNSHIAPR